MTILELNHVALHVRDLEASIHFYGDILGLPPLAHPDFGSPVAWFALGSQELHLIEAAQGQTAASNTFHTALLVEDAADCALVLRERGITLVSGPAPRPDGAVQVFLRDPDGYLLELNSPASRKTR